MSVIKVKGKGTWQKVWNERCDVSHRSLYPSFQKVIGIMIKVRKTIPVALAIIVSAVPYNTPSKHAIAQMSDLKGAKYSSDIGGLNAEIRRNPKSPDAYLKRGKFYLNTFEDDLAMSDFDRAVALAPSYSESYFVRGELFKNMGEFDKAIRDLKVAATSPDRRLASISLRLLAGCYGEKHEYTKAADIMTQAISKGYTKQLGLRDRAVFHFRDKKYSEAISDVNDIQASELGGDTILLRANSRRELGQYKSAIEDYGLAERLFQKARGGATMSAPDWKKLRETMQGRVDCLKKMGNSVAAARESVSMEKMEKAVLQQTPFRGEGGL